jgi:hypothetical protein
MDTSDHEGCADWILQQLRNNLSNDDVIQSYGISAFKRKTSNTHIVKIHLHVKSPQLLLSDYEKILFDKVPILEKYRKSIVLKIVLKQDEYLL